MGSSTEEFPTIDTTHLWSNLKMEDDLDDDALLIELHCLIHSTSKLRFEKRAIIGDSQYTDETAEEGQAYIKKQKHPGPNFVHPNITRTDTILIIALREEEVSFKPLPLLAFLASAKRRYSRFRSARPFDFAAAPVRLAERS